MKPLFYGMVKKGKTIFGNPDRFKIHLAKIEGKEFELSIEVKRKKRSLKENAYLHGVVIPILADFFGYTQEEMKDVLKYEFLKVYHDNGPSTIKRTRDLTTIEMERFLDNIRTWADLEYNCFIPLPGEGIEF